MKLVSLTICLFNLFKTKALECLSVINRKFIPRPKIFDVNLTKVLVKLYFIRIRF